MARRPGRTAAANAQNRYDAAGNGRRIAKWNPPSSGPQKALENIERLRRRVQDALRNDWAAESSTGKWVSNLVGVGIQPRWKNKKYREIWDRWGKQADADSVLDIYGLQALAVRTWLAGGECFGRRRPRALTGPLDIPLQIQLHEAEMVPMLDADVWPGLPQGNTIRQGVERNRFGRRIAVWFYREHPGDGEASRNAEKYVRVAWSDVAHLYIPPRPGALRGVSPMAAVLTKLRSIGDFDDATLDRQKLANLFAMFITRPLPADQSDLEYDPITGLLKAYDQNGVPMVTLESGISAELRPGEDVKFANPPEAGTTYSDYMRTAQLGTAAGQHLPYELMAGDIKDISDRTLRVLINEFRRMAQQRQWLYIIPQMCQRMVEWCMDAAALAGEITLAELVEAKKPTWNPQGWEYIHPVQDAQGKQLLVDMGAVALSDVILERGEDPERVFQQRSDDKKRQEELDILPEAPEMAPGQQAQQENDDQQQQAVQALALSFERFLTVQAAAQAPAPAAPAIDAQALAGAIAEGIRSVVAAQTEGIRALAERPVNLSVAAPQVSVAAPTVVNNIEPTPVAITNNIEPTPVTVAAPSVQVTNEVQPAAVSVDVNLPARETTSLIERDRNGNIAAVTQTERTIQ